MGAADPSPRGGWRWEGRQRAGPRCVMQGHPKGPGAVPPPGISLAGSSGVPKSSGSGMGLAAQPAAQTLTPLSHPALPQEHPLRSDTPRALPHPAQGSSCKRNGDGNPQRDGNPHRPTGDGLPWKWQCSAAQLQPQPARHNSSSGASPARGLVAPIPVTPAPLPAAHPAVPSLKGRWFLPCPSAPHPHTAPLPAVPACPPSQDPTCWLVTGDTLLLSYCLRRTPKPAICSGCP